MHQGARDHQALRHASRKPAHLVVLALAETELFQKLVCFCLAFFAAHAVIGGVKGENLADPQTSIEIAHLRNNRDVLLDSDGIVGHVETHDGGRTGGGDHAGD